MRDELTIRGLAVAYALVWLALAIAPYDRGDWLLENLLVFVFAAALAATWRRFRFSLASYLAITAFLLLHAVGAHYTYSRVPLGFWVQEALGLSRNHYDRWIHFAFGLLLCVPLREIATRALGLRGAASYVFAGLALLACSAGYEIVEWWAARIVDPELGTAFLGTQGDEWDAQKDMSLALAGAVLSLSTSAAAGAARARAPAS